MARGGVVAAVVVVIAIFLVWVLAFGGYATLISWLPKSPGPGPSSSGVSATIDSVTPQGATEIAVSQDAMSASLSDTNAGFGAIATTTINLDVKHNSLIAVQAAVSLSVPEWTSNAGSWSLIEKQGTGAQCPLVTYANPAGVGGTVISTSSPCGGFITLNAGDSGFTMAVTLTMEVGLFNVGAPGTGTHLTLVIHIVGAADLSVVWQLL